MPKAVTAGIPDRLKLLRAMLGYETGRGFAAFIGVKENRYTNMERGLPLSGEVAIRICQRVPGMSLDWLYFGRPDGLPLELARRLGELPAAFGGHAKIGRRPKERRGAA